jgi:hypothetical protein
MNQPSSSGKSLDKGDITEAAMTGTVSQKLDIVEVAEPTPIIAESGGAPSIQLLDIRIAENQMLSDFYERKVTRAPATSCSKPCRSDVLINLPLLLGATQIHSHARSSG